jgi:hypothetical protein
MCAGLGFGGSNRFHGEMLPYIGIASAKNVASGSIYNRFGDVIESSSTNYNGTITLYGVTVGAYYCPEVTKGGEFGARIGYVGASGTLESNKVEQSGV